MPTPEAPPSERWQITTIPLGEAAEPPAATLAVLEAYSRGCSDPASILQYLTGPLQLSSEMAKTALSKPRLYPGTTTSAQGVERALQNRHLPLDQRSVGDFFHGRRPRRLAQILDCLSAGITNQHEVAQRLGVTLPVARFALEQVFKYYDARTSGQVIRRAYQLRQKKLGPPPQLRMGFFLPARPDVKIREEEIDSIEGKIRGLTDVEVAQELEIPLDTHKSRVRSLYRRLEARNSKEAETKLILLGKIAVDPQSPRYFTPQQIKVVASYACGKGMDTTHKDLGLTVRTVKTYAQRALKRAGVESHSQLIRYLFGADIFTGITEDELLAQQRLLA